MSETRHQCEYLGYRDWVCELSFPGEPEAQRWVLRNADGLITDQALLFCPCCGRDFRADCWWQIPGRPQENEILRRARAAGSRPKCICHGPDMIAEICPIHETPTPLKQTTDV